MNLYKTIENLMPERIPAIGAAFYNAIPAKRFRKYYSFIADSIPVNEGRILDIGTGPGYLPIEIAKKYSSIEAVGIDISEKMVEIAKKNAKGISNVEFMVMDAKELVFDDNSFDFVVSSGSSHHWKAPVRIYNEIHRVLKRDCHAWIYELCPDKPDKDSKGMLTVPYPLFRIAANIHGIPAADYQTKIKGIIEATEFSGYTFEKQGIAIRIVLKK